MLVSDMDEIACDALKSWLWSSVELVFSLDIRMISYGCPTMGRERRNLLLQESVDVFEIVQAIVYEELEFGDDGGADGARACRVQIEWLGHCC